jgi:hypothetical protein
MEINRYLIGFAVVILLMIVGIILLFGGGGEKPKPGTAPVVKPLPEYSTTYAEVSLTTRGQINGEDLHRSIRITVGQFQRRVDVIAGYSGNIIQSQVFSNSEPAYEEFLFALRDAGFTLQKKGVGPISSNEKGKCPLGQVYIFELNDSGEQLSYLWSSSCGKNIGTLNGNSSLLQQLFKNQITDYNQLISGVRL